MNQRIKKFIIGVDEAGRGPLAGPLAVGAVGTSSLKRVRRFFTGIRDSKKLSEKKREEWYAKITSCPDLVWAVAFVSPKVVDAINIANAAKRGAHIVFKKLVGKEEGNVHVLLDGSLYLPKGISQETIIKGDEKVPLIAASSIIAKVTRDRLMRRLDKKFPQYGFAKHKGYGTKLHYARIAEQGLSSVHRVSFCEKNIYH